MPNQFNKSLNSAIALALLTPLNSIAQTSGEEFVQDFFDLPNQVLVLNGVDVPGVGTFDLRARLTSAGNGLELFETSPSSVNNSNNSFDTSTNVLSVNQLAVGADTFHVELPVTQTEPTVQLGIGSSGPTFDPTLQREWTVDYSNDFPDDSLILDPGGDALLATFGGTINLLTAGLFIVDLGASLLRGTLDLNTRGGTFNHFSQEGTFALNPANTNETLSLNNGRFTVTTSWNDGTQSGAGQAVPLTESSGYFFFSDASNTDLLIRVLDACQYSDQYWVFASSTSDVEMGITVTDTQSGEQKTYGNSQGQSFQPVQDTSAFATCP